MVAEKDKRYERYKKNPVVLFYGDKNELGHFSNSEPSGFIFRPLISRVVKIDPRTTRILGAYGAFQFFDRGKRWEVSFAEFNNWTLIGEFEHCLQVDKYEDLLYLRAVKLKEQSEGDT